MPALAARQHRDPMERSCHPRTGCAQPSGRCGPWRRADSGRWCARCPLEPHPPATGLVEEEHLRIESEVVGDLERALAPSVADRGKIGVGVNAHRISNRWRLAFSTSTRPPQLRAPKMVRRSKGLGAVATRTFSARSTCGTRLRSERRQEPQPGHRVRPWGGDVAIV